MGMQQGSIGQDLERAKMCLVIMLLFWVAIIQPCIAISLPFNDDVLGLIVFKADLQDPNFVLNSWNENDPSPCNWTGITCSPSSGRVIEVSLDGLSLSGPVGKGLLKVDQLEKVSLSWNNLSGILPELSGLESLRLLNLSHNSLSGPVPEGFGSSSLQFLDLSHNRLSGLLPTDMFQDCTSLKFLWLSGNLLDGPLPQSLTNCKQLIGLDLSANNFVDQIPPDIGSLYSLSTLDLSMNNFSGTVSSQVAASGNLTYLNLSRNKLTGGLPPEILNSRSLRTLDLTHNMFEGSIPPPPQNLPPLSIFRLGYNHFSGNIPDWIADLHDLEELDLSANDFTGTIPSSFGYLHSLQRLNLARNRFSGAIPQSLSECVRLANIDFSNNNLSGPIPSAFFVLDLQKLVLANNNLTGSFPSLSNLACRSLELMDVSENGLEGMVPPRLGQCSNLYYLNFADNALSGSIPTEVIGMPTLKFLDLSGNFLNGSIPYSVAGASSLLVLYLERNQISGPIPTGLGNLTNLRDLSLAHNVLTGGIPSVLGRLKDLTRLDLSLNYLTGEIPADFGSLQNLVRFNVSHNQLTGPLPNGGIFNKLDASSFVGNGKLCGAAIGTQCPAIPKPIVVNPNTSENGDTIFSPQKRRKKIVLSVSAIVAIVAASAIAMGIVIITVLNIFSQIRPRPNFLIMDSMPNSPSQDFEIGKLVMFGENLGSRNASPLTTHALVKKDCEIGRGGFGIVYKTLLDDGHTVAVKKLSLAGLAQSQQEFEKHVEFLGRVKHSNLVALHGYYWTPKIQLLIYEYVPSRNLYSRIHERTQEAPLSWPQRFHIIMGIASGLAHLHHGCRPHVIHYNIKSCNVLLEVDLTPRISDCGLAKLLPVLDRYVLSSKLQSALGYMAPEFACESIRISEKCDVYGFGVILLELVTGKRPVEYMEDDVVILCDYVRALLDSGRPLVCVDRDLKEYPEDEVLPIIKLGLICTSQIPSSRPSMAEVLQILELIKPLGDDMKDSV